MNRERLRRPVCSGLRPAPPPPIVPGGEDEAARLARALHRLRTFAAELGEVEAEMSVHSRAWRYGLLVTAVARTGDIGSPGAQLLLVESDPDAVAVGGPLGFVVVPAGARPGQALVFTRACARGTEGGQAKQ